MKDTKTEYFDQSLDFRDWRAGFRLASAVVQGVRGRALWLGPRRVARLDWRRATDEARGMDRPDCTHSAA
jgi:hypothetical protein